MKLRHQRAVSSAIIILGALMSTQRLSATDTELGEHGFAQSGDVTIHYVTAGEGPLLVLIHGFPDYWYTWRKQMPELSKSFKVVAIDQRGYNKSDKPDGVENYTLTNWSATYELLSIISIDQRP